MKDKFIKWILETYDREIYEYENHEYFTLDDMKEAYMVGKKHSTEELMDKYFKTCGEK